MQLEAALPNAGPTRFERRHGELALCQRYYASLVVGMIFYAAGTGTTYRNLTTISLPVTMRATPTIAIGSSTLSSGGTMMTNAPTSYNFEIYIDPTASGSVTDYGRTITASAEL